MNFLGIGACREERNGGGDKQEPRCVGKRWKISRRQSMTQTYHQAGYAPEQAATTQL
jgi:hypothetical protein